MRRAELSGERRGWANESYRPATPEWYTPPHVFAALGLEFELDPCSPREGPVPWVPARRHLTLDDNGLEASWEGRVWLNPPYGDETPRWLGKLAEHGDGIGLVMARTDTAWFHGVAPRASLLGFVCGRLELVPGPGVKASRPQSGSLLIAFGDECADALLSSGLCTCVAVVPARAPTATLEVARRG